MLALNREQVAIGFSDEVYSAIGSPPARPVVPEPYPRDARSPLGIIAEKPAREFLKTLAAPFERA